MNGCEIMRKLRTGRYHLSQITASRPRISIKFLMSFLNDSIYTTDKSILKASPPSLLRLLSG
jgi:hypothetical protein